MSIITTLRLRWQRWRTEHNRKRYLRRREEITYRYQVEVKGGNIYLMCRDTAVARFLQTDTVKTILATMEASVNAALEYETKGVSDATA